MVEASVTVSNWTPCRRTVVGIADQASQARVLGAGCWVPVLIVRVPARGGRSADLGQRVEHEDAAVPVVVERVRADQVLRSDEHALALPLERDLSDRKRAPIG